MAVRKLTSEDEAEGAIMVRRVITPALAADWIAKNTKNRPVRQALVLKYAEDLRRKRWLMNGATIVMASSGAIIDGQHRLLAIIQAGVPMDTFVASGVDEESFSTIDSGTSRRFSDVLHILGYPSATTLAAVTRSWWEYQKNGKLGVHGKEQPPTNLDLLAVVQGNSELFNEAVRATNAHRKLFAGSSGAWAIAWIACGLVEDGDRDHFFARLEDGQNLAEGEAIFALRRMLLEADQRRHPLPPNTLLALLFKAWNKFRAQELTAVMIYRASEGMPIPR